MKRFNDGFEKCKVSLELLLAAVAIALPVVPSHLPVVCYMHHATRRTGVFHPYAMYRNIYASNESTCFYTFMKKRMVQVCECVCVCEGGFERESHERTTVSQFLRSENSPTVYIVQLLPVRRSKIQNRK